ncbi:Death-associated inhibitor of apoptosis 1 [Carabus blaptoides fortunei]
MPPDSIRGSSDIGTQHSYPSWDENYSLKRRSIIDNETATDKVIPVQPKAQKMEDCTDTKEATTAEDIKEQVNYTPSSDLPTSSSSDTMNFAQLHHMPNYLTNKDITETDNGDRKTTPTMRHQPCEITRNMKKERDRLLTYINWPLHYMDPKDLAKAGFYSTHYEDAVRCAFCNVEICRWEEGDDPMADHQRWANNCPFVRGMNVGNIPMDPNDKVELPCRGQDTCGRYGIQVRPNSVPERSEQNIDLNAYGITPNRSPAYPNYATLEARLRTFKEWPLSIKQKPDELAGAGFFYTGKGDQTMCFSCGGGLKDWLEADDPWEQHARWFTKCSFVLMGAELRTQESSSSAAAESSATTSSRKSSTASSASVPATATLASNANSSKKVDDGRVCKICYTEELGVVFLPCGHIVACVKCAPSLSTCAVCRQPFTATVRAFLS